MDTTYEFLPCALSGGLAGFSIDFTLHPLDYIKTRIHRRQKLDRNFKSYYKGLSAAVFSSFPCAATFWVVYMSAKKSLSEFPLSRPIVESVSSVIGSLASCVVKCPFEQVKQLAQTKETSDFLTVFRKILTREGPKGLYKGFSALTFREVPFDTIQMLIFQLVKYFSFFGTGENAIYLYGALAGGMTAFITTPIDVIKTLTMVDSSKYTSFFSAFQDFYRENGFFALWRGWPVRVIYISLGGMLYFGVFNSTLIYLRDNNS